MSLLLPGVLVPATLVGSSGFHARVGERVALALDVYCRHRTNISGQDPRQEPASRSASAEPDGELVLTGLAVPINEPGWLGGWVLDVSGMLVHVTEAEPGPGDIAGYDDRDSESDPGQPAPAPGTWVRVRGVVSVADDYVADEAEQQWQLRLTREWTVQRIRTTDAPDSVIEEITRTRRPVSYLIDLVTPT